MSQHVIEFKKYEETFENIVVMAEGVKGFLGYRHAVFGR
jgi:hypothetical protein